jgi:DnaD/phage-associated family protein
MPWFRVYSEILDDRKIKRICKRTGLSKAMVIGTWVCLLALASDSPERGSLIISGGMPYTVDEIADELGIDYDTTENLLHEFIAMNMIAVGDTMAICNWGKRQYKSDSSMERVRRFREKNDVTLQKRYSNVLDTDTDTDTDRVGEKLIKEVVGNSQKTTAAGVFNCYQQNIGMITAHIKDELIEAESKYTTEWVVAAIQESTSANVRRWSYVKSILERWSVDGFKSEKPKNGNGRYPPAGTPIDNIPVFHAGDQYND